MAGGRPTVMTPEVIRKLEDAFAMGCSDLEACLVADISKSTLYDYQVLHPEFVERKEKLKETPVLKARQTILDNLDDPNNAKWYLERKRKDEFSQQVNNKISGDKENPIYLTDMSKLTDEELERLESIASKIEDTEA